MLNCKCSFVVCSLCRVQCNEAGRVKTSFTFNIEDNNERKLLILVLSRPLVVRIDIKVIILLKAGSQY